MNGAHASSARSSPTASTSASPTRAPRRCSSSPRSTTCPRCAPCSRCSKASRPARPTATAAWPDRPAATLLHLGPGLGNGIANLHNARRARTPIVNIVGDQATYHRAYDAPLTSDIDALARNVSRLDPRHDAAADRSRATRPTRSSRRRRRPGRSRRSSSPPTRRGSKPASRRVRSRCVARREVPGDAIDGVAKALRSGEPAALLLGGAALRERGAARREPRRATRRTPSCWARCSRPGSSGARACPPIERLGYFAEFALAQLDGVRHLVLVDTPRAGVVLRLSRQAEPARARRLRGAHARTRRRRCRARARAPRRRARCRRRRRDVAAGRPSRTRRRVTLTAQAVAAALGATAARGRDRRRRGADERTVRVRRDRGCTAPRLAHAHRRRDRLRACRSQRAPRSRVRIARCVNLAGRRQRDVHAAGALDAGA